VRQLRIGVEVVCACGLFTGYVTVKAVGVGAREAARRLTNQPAKDTR
jgi:hypothetical protein